MHKCFIGATVLVMMASVSGGAQNVEWESVEAKPQGMRGEGAPPTLFSATTRWVVDASGVTALLARC